MTDEGLPDPKKWSDDALPTRPRRDETKYGDREAKALLDRFRTESGEFADQRDNWAGSDIGQILEVYDRLDPDLQTHSPELLNKLLGILQRDLARYLDKDFAQSPQDMHYVLTYSQSAIKDIFTALDEEKSAEEISQQDAEEAGEQVYLDTGFSPLRDALGNTGEMLATIRAMGESLMQAPEAPVMGLPVYNDIAAIEHFYNDSFPCDSNEKGKVYDHIAALIKQEYQDREVDSKQVSHEDFANAMDELARITRGFITEVNSANRSTSGYLAIYKKNLGVFKEKLMPIIDTLEDAWETWPSDSMGKVGLDNLLETLQHTEMAINKTQEKKRC